MKLYTLILKGDVDYDTTAGFIVRAEDEDSARKLCAKTSYGDEVKPKYNPWLDPDGSSCKEVLSSGKEEIIMMDFRAG